MKQHITVEQLGKLSEKGKNKLRKWWKPEVGDLIFKQGGGSWRIDEANNTASYIEHDGKEKYLLLPSIGQMIEFLDEKLPEGNYQLQRNGERDGWRINSDDIEFNEEGKKELCDALWSACKGVLKHE